jgi:hypothetical protein
MTDEIEIINPRPEDIFDPGEQEVILVDPIWKHQPHIGETSEDYQVFLKFAELAPTERNINTAWRNYLGDPNASRIMGDHFYRIRRFQWAERAAAWDIDKIKQANRQDWISKDEKRRAEDYEFGELLKETARVRIEKILNDNEELSVTNALRLLEAGSQLQRDAIPKLSLEKDKLAELMDGLPVERRQSIIAILVTKYAER